MEDSVLEWIGWIEDGVYRESGSMGMKSMRECGFELVHIENSLFAQNFRNFFRKSYEQLVNNSDSMRSMAYL